MRTGFPFEGNARPRSRTFFPISGTLEKRENRLPVKIIEKLIEK
jgi:hypothetical protein